MRWVKKSADSIEESETPDSNLGAAKMRLGQNGKYNLASQQPASVLIVDIVGPGGSGKSTIASLLNKELAARMLRPTSEAKVGHAESEEITHWNRGLHAIRHPDLVIVATRLVRIRRANRSKSKAFLSHLSSLLRRSILLERSLRSGQPFLVIPQGLISQLLTEPDEGLAKIPQRIQPSVVVELEVPPHEYQAREITRDKPVREPLTTHQSEHAQAVYSRLRQGFETDEASELLSRWNAKYCSPALPSEALSETIDAFERELSRSGREEAPSRSVGSQIEYPHKRVAGVPWMKFDNRSHLSPLIVASRIGDALIHHDQPGGAP